MKEEQAEGDSSLAQWLHPSRMPLSYLGLLNGDPAFLEDDAAWDVEETIDFPTDGTDVARKAPKVHSDRAAGNICSGETSTDASVHKIAGRVKPSDRVQSRGNHEPSGSYGKLLVNNQSSAKLTHPWTQRYAEKLTKRKKELSDKDNRDFSHLYREHRAAHQKQSNMTRQRNYTSERERKVRIANNIEALQELLPNPVEDNPEAILNDIVAHVKLLQLQVKELSRSRLAGEATAHLLLPIEGYGHYIHQEQRMDKPLEEMMGSLLETDPEAAARLLESKGLYLMPMSLAEGLH